MRSIIRTTAIVIAAIATVAGAASPPSSLTMIPPQINYQGRLVTSSNTPYADANHVIDLSLYPTAASGAKIWSERYTVPTRDGYFSVNLGAGGTGLLATNLPVWQAMWNGAAGAAETNNFFMALTVRTDPNGAAAINPAEATPRQQFLTAPFAYRAHQSVYARKADASFDAPYGIATPTISGVSNRVEVNGALSVSGTLYANKIIAEGTSPSLTLSSSSGPLQLGMQTINFGYGNIPFEAASSINIGAQSTFNNGPGSDVQISGRTIDIGTTNLTIKGLPMFVYKMGVVNATTTSTTTLVPHGINTASYDVMVVGHYNTSQSPVRGVYVESSSSSGRFNFTTTPTGGQVWIWFLGIRKGLTNFD